MELTGRTGGDENRRGHSAAVHSVDFGGCSPARLVTDSVTAATGSKDGHCKVRLVYANRMVPSKRDWRQACAGFPCPSPPPRAHLHLSTTASTRVRAQGREHTG